MKINQQLFEDVLSCKLKGTFVLRNGIRINTSDFKRNVDINDDTVTYPYIIRHTYTRYGFVYTRTESDYDIVDFIPDKNMKENELTIEIPEGKIVDWESSQKQNKIVFKDEQLNYRDVCEKLFDSKKICYIHSDGTIIDEIDTVHSADANNALTHHQLECILAKNKLANVAIYLNDGWKPKSGEAYHTLVYDRENKTIINSYKSLYCNIGDFIFKTREAAQQAIEILGAETVKLALEPLGF